MLQFLAQWHVKICIFQVNFTTILSFFQHKKNVLPRLKRKLFKAQMPIELTQIGNKTPLIRNPFWNNEPWKLKTHKMQLGFREFVTNTLRNITEDGVITCNILLGTFLRQRGARGQVSAIELWE